MKIIDISPYIEDEMITYPGDAQFQKTPICTIERSGCNMTKLILGTHTGSHIDVSSHFFSNGTPIDKVPLSAFIGKAQVIEVREKEITSEILRQRMASGIKRLLFKTKNSALMQKREFLPDYTYLTQDGAQFLRKSGVKLVGIDYISIERFGTPDFSVHKTLFKAGICILEGIDLLNVSPGYYTLIALPLKLRSLDGSPVRAILIPNNMPISLKE